MDPEPAALKEDRNRRLVVECGGSGAILLLPAEAIGIDDNPQTGGQ